ncbi:Glycosyltransferase involved in cell wall bisynthesis [Amycolatopsis marina]|uniref:Glycosyltransferase involved in cell wall bisynthesis n=1 Tax=Amycolatopsis marina TaxID=490629 RepID=A0A1I1CVZ3_9PSEU|nr:glycosyltransferase family 4 protein [Amycolatopsis marina]SFB64750.1 Glycosyltransferase involved in cell wall bisynthesis [Amycolatopsis marina]
MSATPGLVFLLDTPNLWRGRALAGTPARVLALAEHSHRAGAAVTLVLCDRGADYGTAAEWPMDVLLVHPADFYSANRLARALDLVSVDFLSICEAETLVAIGRELAQSLGARLVYDVHDDDAAVAFSLGEVPERVRHSASVQRAALDACDYVLVSTSNEARLAARSQIDPARTAMLPNGADPRQHTCWGPDVNAGTLVFVGNLYYEPNARAVEAIRTTILPTLRTMETNTQVRVIGRGPAELTRPAEGMTFTGRVDAINHALRDATVALAPLPAGSGAKIKVLDYMAAGLPVLGTTEAVTGLPPDHPGVVVENDLHAWPSVLATLLRDRTALREIGTDGRLCIERELSWQHIATDLLRHIHTWLATPTPPPHHPTRHQGPLGTPRWLAEHTSQNALGSPDTTAPGHTRWLHRTRTDEPSPVRGGP